MTSLTSNRGRKGGASVMEYIDKTKLALFFQLEVRGRLENVYEAGCGEGDSTTAGS
jgi:hypothetical protein